MASSKNISNKQLTSMLNKSIGSLVGEVIKIAVKDFSSGKSLVNILFKQRNTGKIRSSYEDEGLHVPPFIIASITSTCNLKCKGCYDRSKHHNCSLELSEDNWSKIFDESTQLGVSFILLAGGEPLTKDKVIKKCIDFPEIIFPMFTNGLLIDDKWVSFFTKCRNLIPVLSIEGDKTLTDNRRGSGVFERVSLSLDLLQKNNIFYGTSITLTSENFNLVLDESFIKDYIDRGCKLFFFIEYIPFDAATENLVVTHEQKLEVDNKLNNLREKFKAIFLDFPGDEKAFGGCLAAGRGFVHINASGEVEACPFAPYSDSNLRNLTLKQALKSPKLEEIRNLHGVLQEHKGGCTLFDNKEFVEKSLSNMIAKDNY